MKTMEIKEKYNSVSNVTGRSYPHIIEVFVYRKVVYINIDSYELLALLSTTCQIALLCQFAIFNSFTLAFCVIRYFFVVLPFLVFDL